MIHPRIQQAIQDLVETFGVACVTAHEMPDGSVWVTVHARDLGPGWSSQTVDLAVKLVATFPDTHPYPWFLSGDAVRTDGHVVDRLGAPSVVDGVNRRQLSLDGPWIPGDSLAARFIAVERWLRRQQPAKPAAA